MALCWQHGKRDSRSTALKTKKTTTTKDVLIQYLVGPMTKTKTKTKTTTKTTTANLRDVLNHSYLVPWGT